MTLHKYQLKHTDMNELGINTFAQLGYGTRGVTPVTPKQGFILNIEIRMSSFIKCFSYFRVWRRGKRKDQEGNEVEKEKSYLKS